MTSHNVKSNNCKSYKELVELVAESCYKPTDLKPVFMVLSVKSGMEMSNVDMSGMNRMGRTKKELSRLCVELINMKSNVDEGRNVPREIGIER